MLSGDQSESKGWERVWSALLLRGEDDEQRDYDENRLKMKSMVLFFYIYSLVSFWRVRQGFRHMLWQGDLSVLSGTEL